MLQCFSTKDGKFEVNRFRSQSYAAGHDFGIVFSFAEYTPSSDALRGQPDLPTRNGILVAAP